MTNGFLKGAIMGGVTASVVALLYAPQSGRKTRKYLNDNSEKMLRKARKEYQHALRSARKSYDDASRVVKKIEISQINPSRIWTH